MGGFLIIALLFYTSFSSKILKIIYLFSSSYIYSPVILPILYLGICLIYYIHFFPVLEIYILSERLEVYIVQLSFIYRSFKFINGYLLLHLLSLIYSPHQL